MSAARFILNGVCQHIDGGFYRFKGIARHVASAGRLDSKTNAPLGALNVMPALHTEDQSPMVVYQTAQDGALRYRFTTAKHSSDLGDLAIYEHVWPFEASTWGRPALEFSQRFTPVAAGDLELAMENDRVSAQAAISATRSERRRRAPTPQAVNAAPGKIEAMLRGLPNDDGVDR